MLGHTVHNDTEYHSTRPITSWQVIYKLPLYTFGNPLKNLRIEVTYATGIVRFLAPSFIDRAALDKYVARFHPEFNGKEMVGGVACGWCCLR